MYHYTMGPSPFQPDPWNHDVRNASNIMDAGRRYMNYHVIGHMNDGSSVDGILEDIDDQGITMLVSEEVDEDADDMRLYGGYGGGYRRRFRRFRRRRFPFSVFVFPFIVPVPYYYPYY